MYVQTDDAEEVEEQLTAEADSEEDSEDENNHRGSPLKGDGASPTSHESRYTPDWETDSDTDDDSSSTSGEFMWKVSGGMCVKSACEWSGGTDS